MIANPALVISINQQINTILLIIILLIKRPINTDYSALKDKLETNPKAIKFKVIDRVRITKYKNIISKGFKLVKRNSYYRFCFEN